MLMIVALPLGARSSVSGAPSLFWDATCSFSATNASGCHAAVACVSPSTAVPPSLLCIKCIVQCISSDTSPSVTHAVMQVEAASSDEEEMYIPQSETQAASTAADLEPSTAQVTAAAHCLFTNDILFNSSIRF